MRTSNYISFEAPEREPITAKDRASTHDPHHTALADAPFLPLHSNSFSNPHSPSSTGPNPSPPAPPRGNKGQSTCPKEARRSHSSVVGCSAPSAEGAAGSANFSPRANPFCRAPITVSISPAAAPHLTSFSLLLPLVTLSKPLNPPASFPPLPSGTLSIACTPIFVLQLSKSSKGVGVGSEEEGGEAMARIRA